MKNLHSPKSPFSPLAPVHRPARFPICHMPWPVRLGPIFAAVAFCGCQVLTYHSPTGERFSRSSLGANTAIASLTVESGTNGLRRVEMQGYQNDSSQALGSVTEAAVRAAIQSVK